MKTSDLTNVINVVTNSSYSNYIITDFNYTYNNVVINYFDREATELASDTMNIIAVQ